IPPLLNGRRPRGPAGAPRVAVVTTTGGGAASVVDRLGLHGIELASMHDLTMTATKDIYRATLEQLLGSPGCDAVLAAVGSSAQFHPELAVEPIVQATRTAKPLAAFLTPHAERSLALLAEQGVAAFRTPEACADAFAAFFAWRAPRQKMGTDPIISLGEKIGSVPNFELLAALGIPVAEHAVVQAPNFVHSIAYPVALKRLDVEHKTEVGGVVLNIQSGPELAEHARRMGQQRLLVQRMEHGLAEAIVGYRDDPVVGPLVLVGAGGTLAELYQDFAVELAPVSEAEAEAMIARVKGLAVIRGYRNMPRGDVKALAKAVAAFSTLGSEVREAEINPLIVKAQGVVAVDARVVFNDA
ncbi:MAG TPA: acetate--CoA ligase family protein, partial [Burkholderiales bacterium]